MGIALSAVAAVLGVAIALLTVRVYGLSMIPTLNDGDVLLADRVLVHFQPLDRGDLVEVRLPNGVSGVKRLIALPGDDLQIDQAVVLIRPAHTTSWQRVREPYLPNNWLALTACCDPRGRASSTAHPVRLLAGEFFVLGDNRNVSEDSRTFGFLSRDRILGRILFRYWPLRRIGASWPRPWLTPVATAANL